MHANTFDAAEMDILISEAGKIEAKLKAPFTNLIHGDFNADNIIFQLKKNEMYYVDVHRSGFGDYVQDVSVFLISNFRIPVFSNDIRQRLNTANVCVYECAARYAKKNKDHEFDARLALGLFRSLITSTRFIFDKSFSNQLYDRASLILQELIEQKSELHKFKLRTELFIYG